MTDLTPDIAKQIAQHIAGGKSFRSIARLQEMPSRRTIQRWYEADEDFRLLIDNAKRSRNPLFSEGPTPERQRKDGGFAWEPLDRDGKGTVIQTRARANVSSRLDWYFHRGSISQVMHRAGETISVLLFCAGKVPRICVMWRERTQGARGQYERWLNEKSQAQKDLDAALAVLDSRERDALWDVCALDNFASSLPALRTALRALAVHFSRGNFL